MPQCNICHNVIYVTGKILFTGMVWENVNKVRKRTKKDITYTSFKFLCLQYADSSQNNHTGTNKKGTA